MASLSTALPHYWLPPATVAHSRHYMPLGTFDKGREKTTMVFDAWANVGDGELRVRWDVALDTEATALLRSLARSLGYLGRSESWVDAELVDDDVWVDAQPNAFPSAEVQRQADDWEQVTVMAPVRADAYDTWRAHATAEAIGALNLPPGRPTKTHQKRIDGALAPFPIDLADAIQRDTSWWKAHRWSQPPGSRRVVYWRRAGSLRVTTPPRARPTSAPPLEMMLLALTTPSGSTSALPSTTRTLPQAELIHRALVSRIGQGHRVECPELTGRDERNLPLTGHRHAHVWPLDLDLDGHLDHVLVYAPMSLRAEAQRALRSLRRTWTKGGVGELQLAVAGCGRLEDLRRLPEQFRRGVERLLGPVHGARTWTSDTVFVPPRHVKPRGRNTLEGQVNDELVARGLATATVDVLPWDERSFALRHAVRVRPRRPPPVDVGVVLRLSFELPQVGPLALGYGAHFGLGRFRAMDEHAT